MNGDMRICFIGDSFIQGIGDPEHRGWVGRVLQVTDVDITAFNLGIRRNTSDDVLQRCWREFEPRTLAGADNRLVISFGSNDMIEESGQIRIDRDHCLNNLASLLDQSKHRAIAALVVGPPPVMCAGPDHLRRLVELSEAMSALCHARHIPFIATARSLAKDPVWAREALAGDGAHPNRGGYQRLTDIVLAGSWHEWTTRPVER